MEREQQQPFPPIFMPIFLRNNMKYRNLSRHIFSLEEIEWIIFQFSNTRLSRSLAQFSNRYNIPIKRIQIWIVSYDQRVYYAKWYLQNPESCGVSLEFLEEMISWIKNPEDSRNISNIIDGLIDYK
jgi:hypothetical protein